MTSQPPHKQARRSETESKLLDSCEAIFSEHGYDGASVHQIAKHAGVNVSLINRYFGGKRGLLVASIERFAANKFDASLDYPVQPTLAEEIYRYIIFRFRDDMNSIDLMRISVVQMTIDNEFRKEVLKLVEGRSDKEFKNRLGGHFKNKKGVSKDLDLLYNTVSNFSFSISFLDGCLMNKSENDVAQSSRLFAEAIASKYQ